MRLATPTGEVTVKLAKALRPALNRDLALGDWVEASGSQKPDHSGEIKLKAERVLTVAQSPNAVALAPATPVAQLNSRRKAEILVCQKSDCCKLGGKALIQELQAELAERGLNDLQVRGTGCMKRCKAGPNLVMPDKSRYSRIQARDVAAVLDQKFPGSSPAAAELAS